jgi:predicted RNase H-like nuclease
MSAQQTFQVAGVDGCKGGWFVVIASGKKVSGRTDAPCFLKLKRSLVARDFAEVISETTNCKLVCVDIPIGLSDGNRPRECDVTARRVLRWPRASSVFSAPIRPCLAAKDYEMANKICFGNTGKKLTKQSFALLKKIRQVDDLITPAIQSRVREIHPEISFWALNNKKPMRHNKKRLVGRKERAKLLSAVFEDVERIISEARRPKKVSPDDILDALVAAWTACQAVSGKTGILPEKLELDSKGLRMEILCPADYNL